MTTRAESAIITTWAGRHIDLLNPRTTQIHIDDIAAALSRVNRFTGHTHRAYTVAEHCLLGVEQSLPEDRYAFLLHDASEAYLGDVTGPLKRLEGMSFYRELEEAWTGVLRQRFYLEPWLDEKREARIHVTDKRMLATEVRDLMGRRPLSTDSFAPYAMQLPSVAPDSEWLRERFLAKFFELKKLRRKAI